jgi:hypothetical protein
MTAQADHLVVMLRAILATLPDAIAINIHASPIWTLVLISADSDEAVRELADALGLGAPEARIGIGRWWYRATTERDDGTLRIVVVGRHHLGAWPS